MEHELNSIIRYSRSIFSVDKKIKPFSQANVMMLGEMMCMFVYLIYIFLIRTDLHTDTDLDKNACED